jgi:hypothetical protein
VLLAGLTPLPHVEDDDVSADFAHVFVMLHELGLQLIVTHVFPDVHQLLLCGVLMTTL